MKFEISPKWKAVLKTIAKGFAFMLAFLALFIGIGN